MSVNFIHGVVRSWARTCKSEVSQYRRGFGTSHYIEGDSYVYGSVCDHIRLSEGESENESGSVNMEAFPPPSRRRIGLKYTGITTSIAYIKDEV